MKSQVKNKLIPPLKDKAKDIKITKANQKMNKDLVRHIMFSHTP